MAEDELQIVRLKTDFYRDGFKKTIIALSMILATIALIIAISCYLYVTKPDPVFFVTDDDWRVQAPIPVDQPYLTKPEMLQWAIRAIPGAFVYDFLDYKKQLSSYQKYFTNTGWKVYQDLLNIYANANKIQSNKSFVKGSAAGVPITQSEGLVEGRYGWWIKMPMKITTTNAGGLPTFESVIVTALVTRVSTLDNLDGVAIENIIIEKGGSEGQVKTNV